MPKKKLKKWPESKTVQHDTMSISQLLNQYNVNPQIKEEGYLDDDIKNIGKFHRRFVDLTDLDELKQHVKKLSNDIAYKYKELQAQKAEEQAKIERIDRGSGGESDKS